MAIPFWCQSPNCETGDGRFVLGKAENRERRRRDLGQSRQNWNLAYAVFEYEYESTTLSTADTRVLARPAQRI